MDARRVQLVTRNEAQGILQRIDYLDDKLNGLTNTMNSIHRILSTFYSDIKLDMQEVKQRTKEIKSMKDNVKEEILSQTKETEVFREKIKTEMTEINKKLTRLTNEKLDWNKKVKQRKFSFYESYKNAAIAEIYQKALEEHVQRVPKKLFKIPVTQHYEKERQLRKEQSIKQTEHEIKRLRLVSEIKTKIVERIDNDMIEYFYACYDEEEAKLRKDQWSEIISNEEKRSKIIWDNKRHFFESDRHLISINSDRKCVSKDSPATSYFSKKQSGYSNNKKRQNNDRRTNQQTFNYQCACRDNNWRTRERENFQHFENNNKQRNWRRTNWHNIDVDSRYLERISSYHDQYTGGREYIPY